MKIKDLHQFAQNIRLTTLKMVYEAKASHIGGAFSMADILAVLYSGVLNIKPNTLECSQRDRFILSKGHACTSLYAALYLKGFIPKSLLNEYGKDGTYLLSHASNKIPGVELSTGSLGHGLPVACGIALAAKLQKKLFHTFVLLGDGELNEGANWESILFAAHHQLNNLTIIIDYNKIQSLGDVKDIIDLHPLTEKFNSFAWHTIEVDGHKHEQIKKAFEIKSDKPKVIIAHTTKGKGVDFMENKLLWHYKSPSEEEYNQALKQLKA